MKCPDPGGAELASDTAYRLCLLAVSVDGPVHGLLSRCWNAGALSPERYVGACMS